MKRPITKFAAAAALIVARAIVINHLKLNASTEMVPLEIKLPSPMFVGTEKPIRVSNLRKLDTGARPPFPAESPLEPVVIKRAEVLGGMR